MTGAAATKLSWRLAGERIWTFVKANLGRILFRAALAALVGWLINVYLLAVRYEGFAVFPDALATGNGSGFNARLFWGVASTIVFALWGYGRRVGFRELGSKIVRIPSLAVSVFKEGSSVTALVLWGGAVSLVVAIVIGPAVAGLVGVGFLLLAPSPLNNLLGDVLRRLWAGALRAIGPGASGEVKDPFLASLAPGIGTALGMLVAWRVTSTPFKLVLAAVAVVAAYLLITRKTTPGQAAVTVLWLAFAGVAWELMQSMALADDGGWAECGANCSVTDWLSSEGADQVLTTAAQGGVATGVGCVIGSAIGDITADLETGRPPRGGGSRRPDAPPPGTDGDVMEPTTKSDDADWFGGTDLPPRPDAPPPSGTDGDVIEPTTKSDDADWFGGTDLPPRPDAPPPATDGDGIEPTTKSDDADWFGEWFEESTIPPRPDSPPPTDTEILQDDPVEPDDVVPHLEDDEETVTDEVIDEPIESTPDEDAPIIPEEERWRWFPTDDRPTIERIGAGPQGHILVDGEWVEASEVRPQTDLDRDWLEARQRGQELVERFEDINQRLQAATDPAERAQLEADLRQAAIDINADMASKMDLKNQGRTALTAAVDAEVERIYGDVDPAVTRVMNEIGISRGGREFRGHDMYDIRNAASAGTVGADRDIALNEARQRDLESRLAQAEPGSPEANRLQTELQAVRDGNRLTVDYDKLVGHLETQLAGEPAGSHRAAHLQNLIDSARQHADSLKGPYLAELDQRIAAAPEGSSMRSALMAERAAAETRLAGTADAPISGNRWNDIAQDVYNQEYQRVTGTNADAAYQALTQRFNPEAYRDLGVLTGDPSRFVAASAEQTASVSRYKTFHNDHMAEQGRITAGHAVQEDARGYAKDMGTKTLPTLRNDPNVPPERFDQLNRIQQVFERAGRGEILPSQIDAELQRAVPEIEGMNMDKAKTMADTALEAGIKSRTAGEATGPSRVQNAFGRVSDVATIDAYTRQNMAAGMNQGEATAVATAQTMAGNAAMATGITDPRMSMAGGALLPNGMSNMLPDQAVENVVGTTYQGGRAALESAYDSYQSGELDTTALDRFVDSIDERPGVDPYKGIAQAADLMGEEVTRAGGNDVADALNRLTESSSQYQQAEGIAETVESGAQMASDAADVVASGVRTGVNTASNLAGDLHRIYETGAGGEVLNEGISDFQQRVESGEFSAPLQGIDHVARIASDTVVDPGGTVGQFAEDVSTIWEHGVGEGYWEETVETTEEVLSRTPLVGQVVQGYNEIASGVGESGVTGFAGEMAEGAYHLAGETASGAYEYMRSFW